MRREIILLLSTMVVIGSVSYLVISASSLSGFISLIFPLLLLFLIGITTLFLRKCFIWYSSYMLIGQRNFRAKVDRPRVFVFSIFLPFLFVILYVFKSFEGFAFQGSENLNVLLNTLLCVSQISLFFVIILLLYKVLGKSFESLYLPKVQKIVTNSISDFKTKLSANEAEHIFKKLVRHGYLVYEDFDTEKEQAKIFVETFVTGILPSSPIFQLDMDYPQINVVYECFQEVTKDLDWIKFKEIFKSNENEINLGSRSSSVSRAKKTSMMNKEKYYATDQNIIELIFDKSQVYR